MPIHGSGVALLIDRLSDLNFYDEFNRRAKDTDIWTDAHDGGGVFATADYPDVATFWTLTSGNVIDNDSSLIGDAKNSKGFIPWEEGYYAIMFEARLRLYSVVDISSLFGLFANPPTDYAEPATACLQFLADPAISNTFRVRNWKTAEEETDTLVPLDTDFHKFKVLWSKTSVLYYVDDVLVATHTTQIPNVPLKIGLLIRTECVTARSLHIDYIHVEVI